jgi:hypothetical protein
VHCVQGQNNFKGQFVTTVADLAPSDYYLWGAVKGAFYKDRPHSFRELKDAITDFVRNIRLIELSHVFANKIIHVNACLHAHKDHFQHLLEL